MLNSAEVARKFDITPGISCVVPQAKVASIILAGVDWQSKPSRLL